jgi:hypothetical protein
LSVEKKLSATALMLPAVGLSAHGRFQVIRAAEAAPAITPVLRALIGMNQRASGPSPPDGHHHGVEGELKMKSRRRRPADDLAREQIHDDGKVEPAQVRM